jgi:hypothetical protein
MMGSSKPGHHTKTKTTVNVFNTRAVGFGKNPNPVNLPDGS